ncbi:MAG: hypothetical protein PHV59_07500 [Victivallales bacterium]|nr:hypothetical protein [Victivallales bacterium]
MNRIFFYIFIAVSTFSAATAVPARILMADNRWLDVDFLSADKNGCLKVKLDRQEIIIRRRDFVRVEMELPRELAEVQRMFEAGKNQDAASLAIKLADKYNFPPLRLKIKLLLAQIKTAEGDYEGIVSLWLPEMTPEMAKTVPQIESVFRAHGLFLLGNAYAGLSQDDAAREAYRKSFELAVPAYSAPANLALGRMLLAENNFAQALQCFLENIVIFPASTPGRLESLQETVKIYRKMNDNNYKIFEEMLKKEYPEQIDK